MKVLIKKIFLFLIAGLIVSVLFGIQNSDAASGTIVLRYGTTYPPDHIDSVVAKGWMAKIEQETKGRVKFEPYWSGTLIGNQAAMDIKKGVVDIGYMSVFYEKAGFTLHSFITRIFQKYDCPQDYEKIYWGLWDKFPELRKEFDGLKILALYAGGPHRLMSLVPLKSLEDLKGMKIRTDPQSFAVWKELGADVVNVPMTEAYESLQKGIVKAIVSPNEAYKTWRFAEFVKYEYPNMIVSRGVSPSLAMNINTWNKLPPDIQKIFDDNRHYYFLKKMETEGPRHEEGVKLAESYKVIRNPMPQSEVNKFNEIYEKQILKVASEMDAKGLPATKIYKEAQNLLQKGCRLAK